MDDADDLIMVNSIYEQLIGELLIDPVKISHQLLADLEELRWEAPDTQEIIMVQREWPSV